MEKSHPQNHKMEFKMCSKVGHVTSSNVLLVKESQVSKHDVKRVENIILLQRGLW